LDTIKNEITVDLKGLPNVIQSLSFLNGNKYISVSVNRPYQKYFNHNKIIRYNKRKIYSYVLKKSFMRSRLKKNYLFYF
jgi:hypothetical protein